MKTYIALMFAKPEDIKTYGQEVAAAIKDLSAGNMKLAEGGAGVVAVGFASDKDFRVIARVFQDLWRPEQRTWVLPLEPGSSFADKSILEWASKQSKQRPS